jgi:hypothetical protein
MADFYPMFKIKTPRILASFEFNCIYQRRSRFQSDQRMNPKYPYSQTFTYSSSHSVHTLCNIYTTDPYLAGTMCQFARIEYEKCRHVSKEVIKCKHGRSEPRACPDAHSRQYIRRWQCIDCREAEIDKSMKDLGLL